MKVTSKLKAIVKTISHIKKLDIYGSNQTNLDLPSSDIDFVIYSETFSNNDSLSELYDILKNEMEYNPGWISKIDYYPSATIPIIKVETKCDSFEINLDITFKDEMHRGSDWVLMIKKYLDEFENLGEMVMIL